MTGVYLIHFIPKYKHAGHYLGFSEDIDRRFDEHLNGTSDVRLIKVCYDNKIRLILAKVWEGADRKFERKLKNNGSMARICPICKEEKK